MEIGLKEDWELSSGILGMFLVCYGLNLKDLANWFVLMIEQGLFYILVGSENAETIVWHVKSKGKACLRFC